MRGLGGEGRTRRDASLAVHLFSLPHFLHWSLSLCRSSLNLSPQSSVQAAISGHSVTMTTLETLGHRAVGATVGCLSFSRFFCSPVSHRLSLQLLPFLALSFFAQNAEKTVPLCFFTPSSLWGLVYPSLYLSLFCLLYMSCCLSLCLSRDDPAAGWLKVGSPASHVECLLAKHIKAVRRHICQSQMMIRGPGLSKGTELSFVMQDILPHLSVYILHQTLVEQKVSLSEVLAFRGV